MNSNMTSAKIALVENYRRDHLGNLSDKLQAVLDFATMAHKGQLRKYTGDPYILHPIEVMLMIKCVPHDEAMLAAALLHDTVEDTDVIIEEIRQQFGDDIADLVDDLTDVSKPEDGNRAVRKAMDRNHSAKSSPRAQTIKIADLIRNSRSIIEHDRGFAKTYMVEKLQLLGVLTDGNKQLTSIALQVLADYFRDQA